MSLFGGLASTSSTKECSPRTSLAFGDLPRYSFKELVNKDEIGHGGYASVFTAEVALSGEKVAVKKFIGLDEESQKILVKEAKLLNSLQHPNIVGFKGVCDDQHAILLEYVYFDFAPFGIDLKVNSLADLLRHFDKSDCANIDKNVFYHAAEDIALGLQYLHENGLAHRDLKPANVLVSNQHYCHLSSQDEIESICFATPLICKLTDFGESRSQEVHTNAITTTKTGRIDRGTPVFMAPELFVKEFQLPSASLEDLKKADVWAYGMIVFCLANPGLKHPFDINMRAKDRSENPLDLLKKLTKSKEKPISQPKYAARQAGEWRDLLRIYESCTEFLPSLRPNIKDVIKDIRSKSSSGPQEVEKNLVIHLKVSQSSFLESFDANIAAQIQDGTTNRTDATVNASLNDGTNACSFLCIKIADEIFANETTSTWEEIASVSETVITTLPQAINNSRNVALNYDVLEAYRVLKSNGCLTSLYQFSEELPDSCGVFSDEGKAKLLKAVKSMNKESNCIGLYTCEPYILLLGSMKNGIFILDTHPVPPTCGGQSTGILKVFQGMTDESSHSACEWLWQRLLCSGVTSNCPQSLAIMTKDVTASRCVLFVESIA